MKENKNEFPVSLPVIVSREGKWFVAACPLLDIATQGKTEKEVKENIEELMQEYFSDEGFDNLGAACFFHNASP